MLPDALPGDLRAALERAAPRLGQFGRRVLWYPEIGSTNDAANELAAAGEAEGTVVVADTQTAGRGRLGRSWTSPPGAGIYASVILRPHAAVASLVTLAAGVAVAEGIEASTALPVALKWPNDVVTREGRKLAGILAEASAASSVVLGFGINVMPAAYPAAIVSRATSIESELGRPIDRWLVLTECLARLRARYEDLRETRSAEVIGAWRARAASGFGRRVEWDAGGTMQQGVAHDVDADGALLVRTGYGIVRLISGEVRWI